jgi:autonomous glycyl radical cofactor GrcA
VVFLSEGREGHDRKVVLLTSESADVAKAVAKRLFIEREVVDSSNVGVVLEEIPNAIEHTCHIDSDLGTFFLQNLDHRGCHESIADAGEAKNHDFHPPLTKEISAHL